MVTGRRAFNGETSAQVLAAILDDDPEPIARLNPRVPAPMRWVTERHGEGSAPTLRPSEPGAELRTLRDPVEFVPTTTSWRRHRVDERRDGGDHSPGGNGGCRRPLAGGRGPAPGSMISFHADCH
jgi:hypothetical protein